MKRPGKELEKYWYAGLTGFFVIVAALVVYAITSNLTGLGKIFGALNSALMPVYIGVVIAYLLSPLVNKSDRYIFIPLWSKIFKGKKKKASNVARGCSVFFVLLLAIFVVFGIMMLVIPEIIDSITGLAKSMPEYYNNVKNWGTHIFKSNPEFADYFTISPIKKSTKTLVASITPSVIAPKNLSLFGSKSFCSQSSNLSNISLEAFVK